MKECLGNFRNLEEITGLSLVNWNIYLLLLIYILIFYFSAGSVDAILLDLGMSSMQVDSTRGFSFRPEFDGDLGKDRL